MNKINHISSSIKHEIEYIILLIYILGYNNFELTYEIYI